MEHKDHFKLNKIHKNFFTIYMFHYYQAISKDQKQNRNNITLTYLRLKYIMISSSNSNVMYILFLKNNYYLSTNNIQICCSLPDSQGCNNYIKWVIYSILKLKLNMHQMMVMINLMMSLKLFMVLMQNLKQNLNLNLMLALLMNLKLKMYLMMNLLMNLIFMINLNFMKKQDSNLLIVNIHLIIN